MKNLLLFAALVSSAMAEVSEDFRYRYEVLARDLPQPMQMEMAPDGRIYFIEIKGKIRILDPKSGDIKDIGNIEVFTDQENGLLGMTLDPNFKQNGWIYLFHSPKDYPGQNISRFTVKNDEVDMSSRKDLLKWEEQRKECCHHAGCLRFGPDGNLYASVGDNTNPFASDGFSPIDERPDRNPWDAQKSSANTNDLRGKLLRIRPTPDGGYTIPKGNLFPPGTPNTRPEIYAMGFRNPWRFNFDPKTGIVYVGDVGPDSGETKAERGPNGFDTLNQVRKAGFFGWPYVRGNEKYNNFDFTSNSAGEKFDPAKPVNTSPNNTGLKELPPVTPPLIWYPPSQSKEFPILGSGGRTACGGPVFHYQPSFEKTDGFPKQYDNSVLFYDWQRPFIHWVKLDSQSNMTGIEPFTASARLAQGDPDDSERFQIKRPVDAFFGPDGCLYLADYGETWGPNKDSQIIKISYQRGNLAPIAKAKGENTAGREPLTVQLSAADSKDPEGEELSYEWVIQPGGKVFARTAEATATIQKPGNYTAFVRVTDKSGANSVASLPIVVGNTPPEVKFVSPQNGDFFTPGEPLSYKIEVNDREDGNSSGAKASQIDGATFVSADWQGADGKKAEGNVGMTLMKQSTCFNCHSVDHKIVGPALQDIATKYKGQAGAMEESVNRVLKGSTGIWGNVPMLPHPQHSKDELHMMVSWIYSLAESEGGAAVIRGLSGQITPPKDDKIRIGHVEATFTDFGFKTASPLPGKAQITLRSRTLEADQADEVNGPKVQTNDGATGKRFLGHIGSNSFLRYDSLNLQDSASVTVRVARPGNEKGKIEIRSGSQNGDVLAEIEFEPTGGWETWKEFNAPLKQPKGRGDIYVIFKTGMNIDWLRFDAK